MLRIAAGAGRSHAIDELPLKLKVLAEMIGSSAFSE
jgi:hypothetical protein